MMLYNGEETFWTSPVEAVLKYNAWAVRFTDSQDAPTQRFNAVNV